MHPDHMLRDMTDEEWQGWLWFSSQEPWGFPERDLRHGTLLAAVLAPHMPKGQRADPRSFMFRPPEEEEMSPEKTEALLDAMLGVRAS